MWGRAAWVRDLIRIVSASSEPDACDVMVFDAKQPLSLAGCHLSAFTVSIKQPVDPSAGINALRQPWAATGA